MWAVISFNRFVSSRISYKGVSAGLLETVCTYIAAPITAPSVLPSWLPVVAGFLSFVIAWGPATAFGTFQDYYERGPLKNMSSSRISWIGTVNAFLLVATGVCAGPLFDRGYIKSLIIIGCVTVVFGMMMLSLCDTYYQIILSQGVCVGFGAGLIYVPTLALVNTSFTGARRSIANGIVALGASIGGIIFPIIFLKLEPSIGFAWTVRTLAFIQLGCSVVIIFCVMTAQSPEPRPPRGLIQCSAFREPAFTLYATFAFLFFMAYFIPMFYVPVYAVLQLHTSTVTGLYLLAGLNAGSAVGRMGSVLVAQKLGLANLLVISSAICGILLFAWIPIHSIAGFAAFCVLYGLFSGVMITVLPMLSIHPAISPTPAVAGTRMGMLWFFGSLGILIGAPIASALKSGTGGTFLRLQIFSGAMSMGGMVFMLAVALILWKHY
ncbi:MFS general substrate transporter [Aspergillus ambiguus]|uniref:putative MFS monocarboxylate transporter n=1 Tax=Aspergillus ambiguus TaxID=176160 RepID=UPI003CCDDE8B